MAAQPVLPGVLASVAPLLDHYGYLAVAGLLVLENLGLPVPGETVLIAGSLYAGAGRLNIVAVGLLAVAASVVGSCIGYAIGRFGGRALVERYGRYVLLTGERLDKAEAFFDHRGGVIIVIARFISAPSCGWPPGPASATSPATTSPSSTGRSRAIRCTC